MLFPFSIGGLEVADASEVKYRFSRQLGAGTFGRCYLVENVENGQTIRKVMKIVKIPNRKRLMEKALRSGRKLEEEEMWYFNEISMLKRVKNCAFVVRSYETFLKNSNTQLCTVLEWAQKGDLSNVVSKHRRRMRRIPVMAVTSYVAQIALGLEFLHDQLKMLHRDLKTENVFVFSSGRVCLGDLGVSRALEEDESCARTVAGTPACMSPEMYERVPYNDRTDIWSLGVVLYELLTLRKPFAQRLRGELEWAVVEREYRVLESDTHDPVFNELARLHAKTFEYSPSDRPTAKQILQDCQVVRNVAKRICQRVVKGICFGELEPRRVACVAEAKKRLFDVKPNNVDATVEKNLSEIFSDEGKLEEEDFLVGRKMSSRVVDDASSTATLSFVSSVNSGASEQTTTTTKSFHEHRRQPTEVFQTFIRERPFREIRRVVEAKTKDWRLYHKMDQQGLVDYARRQDKVYEENPEYEKMLKEKAKKERFNPTTKNPNTQKDRLKLFKQASAEDEDEFLAKTVTFERPPIAKFDLSPVGRKIVSRNGGHNDNNDFDVHNLERDLISKLGKGRFRKLRTLVRRAMILKISGQHEDALCLRENQADDVDAETWSKMDAYVFLKEAAA